MRIITFLWECDLSIVDTTSIDFPLAVIKWNYRLVCLYPGGFRSFWIWERGDCCDCSLWAITGARFRSLKYKMEVIPISIAIAAAEE